LLVRLAGTVREVGSNYFTIADGYTTGGVEVATKVIVGTAWPTPTPAPGNFIIVTGVVTKDSATSNAILLRP
jgi:hypothetical protein